MKISKLVKELNKIKKEVGDADVYLSSDEEGNSFGSIGSTSFGLGEDNKNLVIYPEQEYCKIN